jgi:hypothetical protein
MVNPESSAIPQNPNPVQQAVEKIACLFDEKSLRPKKVALTPDWDVA